MNYPLIKFAILALAVVHCVVWAKSLPRIDVSSANETVVEAVDAVLSSNDTVPVVVNQTETVDEASPKIEMDQPVRQVARYMCPPGYTGNSCEDRDPCFFNGPCGAYGRCVASYDGQARCECQAGYTGQTCQNSDPCSAYPCQNGQCVSHGNSFVCQCTQGYTGQLCENSDNYEVSSYGGGGSQQASSCYPNPCQNGGQCNAYGTTYTCQCPTGYSGQRCDYGGSSYGSGGGSSYGSGGGSSYGSGGGSSYGSGGGSSYGGGGSAYESAPSYSSGPCYGNPCQNGGQCVPYGSTFICQCQPGYSGQKCDSGSGGYGGGYQSGGGGGYQYDQYPSYGGDNSGPCYANPCQNGGQCTPYGSTYICQCQPGYSGQRCGQSIYSNNNNY